MDNACEVWALFGRPLATTPTPPARRHASVQEKPCNEAARQGHGGAGATPWADNVLQFSAHHALERAAVHGALQASPADAHGAAARGMGAAMETDGKRVPKARLLTRCTFPRRARFTICQEEPPADNLKLRR